MATDLTAIDAMVKVVYTPKKMAELLYPDSPFFSMIMKQKDVSTMGGKYLVVPILYSNPQGRSRTFATAQSNAGASKYEDFQITLGKDYGVVQFDNLSLELARGQETSFLSMKTAEIDNQIREVKRSLTLGLFGDGTGKRGVISAIASDKVTLTDVEDIVRFEVGQKIVGYTSAGASASSACTITGIDRDNGIIGLSTTSGLANGDYLYVEGDFGATGVKGLQAWLPSAGVTGSDSFFGVNRSVDSQRLAGTIIDGTNLPIYEAVLKGVRGVARNYGSPDVVVLPYAKFVDLEQQLGKDAMYDRAKAVDNVLGIRAIRVASPRGQDVMVIADPDCPSTEGFVLQMDTWTLYSSGEPVKMFGTDGNAMLRMASADAVEARIVSYCQLACKSPGANGVIKL